MAGITNRAFRRVCREFGDSSLYVSEMITSRALVERNVETMRLIEHDPDEHPRSVQLYSTDPATARAAARLLVTEDRADHIDLNFGCPVPKVTRKGGGSALPWKRDLFRSVVAAVVEEGARQEIPVTVKMRKGIDDQHLTYLEAGLGAQDEGAAAVALHARTAAQAYSGTADWSAIRLLKETVTEIPVLGNGDIWSAEDALRLVEEPAATAWSSGVAVSAARGCSPTSPPRSPARRSDCARRSARSPRRCAGTPHTWSPSLGMRVAAAGTSESTSRGTSRASPLAGRCAAHCPWSTRWRLWTVCSTASIPRRRGPVTLPKDRAAGPAARAV
jgi:nifR3 family TIM-barrel protein